MRTFKLLICALLAAATVFAVGCVPEYSTVISDDELGTAAPTEEEIVAVNEPTQAAVTVDPNATPEPSPTPAVTPEPTPEPTPTPKVDPNPDFPYYLYVEKGSFTLTIYGKDDDFEYTKIIAQYRIGHGDTKTPTGIFKLSSTRHRWYTFRLGGSVQYATAYWGNLYIHSPLYGSENNWNMWPKYYNGEYGIGTAHTGGCLRMVTEAAKFIYLNCPAGTTLEIVNGSPRGTTSPNVPPMVNYGYDPTDTEANGGN